jgi:hypothetical protein
VPVQKVSLESASKHFDLAQSQVKRISVNHQDPIYNLGAGLNNYFVCMGASLMLMTEGLNDILERLERIENALKASLGQRRP